MLQIGFVGAGLIGWAHGLCLQAMIDAGLIDAEMAAVYDRDDERAARFGRVTGAAVTSGASEVVARSDAVWVCTPTAAHRAIVEEAASSGRAVFCEKPLATDLVGAEHLDAVVRAAAVPAQVGLVLRTTPVFRAAREIAVSGEFGRPMAAVFRDDQFFPIKGHYGSTWRSDPGQAGGGCLIEHSIHDLDILRFCLGEVAQLSAGVACFAGYEGVEDLATVSLQFDSGASAELVSVWHDITTRGSTRRVELFFERGLVWLDDDFVGPLHVETSEGVSERTCPMPAWVRELRFQGDIPLAVRSYAEEDRAFVDALRAGEPVRPDFSEAVMAHRLVDAAYRSAAGGGVPVLFTPKAEGAGRPS